PGWITSRGPVGRVRICAGGAAPASGAGCDGRRGGPGAGPRIVICEVPGPATGRAFGVGRPAVGGRPPCMVGPRGSTDIESGGVAGGVSSGSTGRCGVTPRARAGGSGVFGGGVAA